MPLQDIQAALFRLYTNPGYRLAYRLDPGECCVSLGLAGADRDFVAGLRLDEVEEFSASLGYKRASSLERVMPTACSWITRNEPKLLDAFLETHLPHASDEPHSRSRAFVAYLEECVLYYDDLPPALPEVARFENMTAEVRELSVDASPGTGVEPGTDTAPETGAPAQRCAVGAETVYWCPPSTRTGSFTVDALAIASRKREMRDTSGGASDGAFDVVMAPGDVARQPIVLRVPAAVVRLIERLRTPTRLLDLVARDASGTETAGETETAARSAAGDASADPLATALRRLESAGVITHVCGQCPSRRP